LPEAIHKSDERKKMKVKPLDTAKKDKKHPTSNKGISVTRASAELIF